MPMEIPSTHERVRSMLTPHALANHSPSGNGHAPTHMPRRTWLLGGALVTLLAFSAGLPGVARAATVANPLCPAEVVFFAPGTGQDITVPPGFTVSVFASGLNAPTGIAFAGNKNHFHVYVLESGHGLPSKCNDQSAFGTGNFDPQNPFTPDILVFDQHGQQIGGPLRKPTGPNVGFQPEGPAI